ncbi:CBS domain containing-hemolysin-like protein [Sediminihabitans luteus]|uniref:CBS domain containing-hemolysin-like protein n=1 Tax=Sediminihabitans luteus TaxID=1138585 RepID=A0A2M9CQE9_9CELL|nr:hemolysin family protein [Sediminihabitans luteus]PJJ74119.1 CBS domain containing-hemolysin-like protein [Sediminihabitans luteus]GII97965.1 membrane protein [Sediminihabitans luteus]
MSAVLLLLAGLALTAVIIAANGYFVAQEFAYMSVDRAALRTRADKGDASARRALAVTRRTSFMLSGAQLGITVTGLMVGYVAEPFIGEAFAQMLGGAGVATATSLAVGTVAALVLATVTQMIFGELFPKNLAIADPDPLARALARSTLIYLAAFGWLVTLFDASSNAVLRLLRVEPVHDVDSSATAQDLERIIDDSRASGDLSDDLSLLLDRVLDFPDRDVEHAMLPRLQVDVVTPATTVAQVRTRMAHGHTRYPVLGVRDEPVGVVELGAVLATAPDDARPVTAIMREPLVVPTVMALPHLLEQLTRTGHELACVIDEYGGFTGIVTIEDLAEELLGDVRDEHDAVAPAGVARDDDGAWVMSGDLPVDEVERAIGRDLPHGDHETLAGLVVAEHGGLPDVGVTLTIALPAEGAELVDGTPRPTLDVEVVRVERHVPSELRVRLQEEDR